MFTNIVVPLDGSELAETALPHVTALASALDAEVVVLQAFPGVTETMSGTFVATDIARAAVREDHERATKYLEGVASRLRQEGIRVRVLVVEGPAASSIINNAGESSLIAMTTHGRSGLKRTLMGSVADEIIRHSKVPVLILRPPQDS